MAQIKISKEQYWSTGQVKGGVSIDHVFLNKNLILINFELNVCLILEKILRSSSSFPQICCQFRQQHNYRNYKKYTDSIQCR